MPQDSRGPETHGRQSSLRHGQEDVLITDPPAVKAETARRIVPGVLDIGRVPRPAPDDMPVLVPLWTTSLSRTAKRVRARRARPNLKSSPKTRDLDRAFLRAATAWARGVVAASANPNRRDV